MRITYFSRTKSDRRLMLLAATIALYVQPIVHAAEPSGSRTARPQIGIQYLTWFDYEHPGQESQGNGWRERPFGLDNVASLVFSPDPKGFCYSSMEPRTATVHAEKFDELGVDFVIFDESNFSKSRHPTDNPTFIAAQQAIKGLRNHHQKRIRAVFQLSITCWISQCYATSFPPGETIENPNDEIMTDSPFVIEHIAAIAELAKANPDDFEGINGKPLILFYISQGSNVKTFAKNPVDRRLAFNGPGNIIPKPEQFNPTFIVKDEKTSLRDFFAVRYAVVADSIFNYEKYSSDIWPFTCSFGESSFSEVGYASLFASKSFKRPYGIERSIQRFNDLVDAAHGKQFIVIRSWNEFSSTDESGGNAYTIEPNTQLHKHDSTPGNQDPWYFYNLIKKKLNSL